MQPMFMRQDAIDDLLVNFSVAKEHYMTNDKEWFDARLSAKSGLQLSRFTFKDFSLSCEEGPTGREEYYASDRENVRILYGAMRNLSPAAASDERLWAGLAHTYCWDYVQYRRRQELGSGKDKDIITSYFFTYNPHRSSYIHCLSRLWWAGYLTYDSTNKEDPFALTDIFTRRAFPSRVLLLASNNFAACRPLTLGMLDAVKELEDSGVRIEREHLVAPARYLNRISGITLLDCLNRDEVRKLIRGYFETEDFTSYKA